MPDCTITDEFTLVDTAGLDMIEGSAAMDTARRDNDEQSLCNVRMCAALKQRHNCISFTLLADSCKSR